MATKIEELRQSASTAWDEFSAEMGKYSDDNLPTSEQAAHIDELRGKATTAQKALIDAESFSKLHTDWQEQTAAMSRSNGKRPPSEAVQASQRRIETIGRRFVELPAYQEWLRTVAPNGTPPTRARLQSPPLHFRGLADLGMRAELITGGDVLSGGALVMPDQYSRLVEFGRRPLTIRQLVTNLTTDSDAVEYVRITGEDINAAVVPEATGTDADASGVVAGTKPESGITFERVSTPVKTIAHWIPATTRALSDAGQLRGIIDSFLRYGLELVLEDQILTGDGLGENFEGILETPNIQVQAFDARDSGSDAAFVTTRVAKRKVRTVGRRIPNAYVLNPEDWEDFEVAKDGNERFYGSGPFGVTTPTLWGLPVVESEAIPVGTGLVGDFSQAVLWDREQASISVSNSHADFFIRNLVAILAELRAAFGVLKPDAFVEIDLTSGS